MDDLSGFVQAVVREGRLSISDLAAVLGVDEASAERVATATEAT